MATKNSLQPTTELSDTEFDDAFSKLPKASPSAKDYGKLLGVSALSTLGGITKGADILTGGAVDSVTGAIAGKGISDILSSGAASLRETVSPGMKESLHKRFVTRENKMGKAWGDPHAWAGKLTESAIPSIAGIVPALRIASTTAKASKAAALARGLTEKAAQKTAQKAAQKAAIVTGGVAEGGIAGGMAATQVEREIMQMSQETLATNPAYQKLIKEGATPESARKSLADSAAKQTFAMTAPAVGATGYAFNKYLGKLISSGTTGGRLRVGATGAVIEAPTEMVQSGAEQAIHNLSIQQYGDPTRPTGQDVLDATVTGGLLGAAMGGTVGTALGGGRTQEQAAQEEPLLWEGSPTAPQQVTRTRAAEVVSESPHAAGVLNSLERYNTARQQAIEIANKYGVNDPRAQRSAAGVRAYEKQVDAELKTAYRRTIKEQGLDQTIERRELTAVDRGRQEREAQDLIARSRGQGVQGIPMSEIGKTRRAYQQAQDLEEAQDLIARSRGQGVQGIPMTEIGETRRAYQQAKDLADVEAETEAGQFTARQADFTQRAQALRGTPIGERVIQKRQRAQQRYTQPALDMGLKPLQDFASTLKKADQLIAKADALEKQVVRANEAYKEAADKVKQNPEDAKLKQAASSLLTKGHRTHDEWRDAVKAAEAAKKTLPPVTPSAEPPVRTELKPLVPTQPVKKPTATGPEALPPPPKQQVSAEEIVEGFAKRKQTEVKQEPPGGATTKAEAKRVPSRKEEARAKGRETQGVSKPSVEKPKPVAPVEKPKTAKVEYEKALRQLDVLTEEKGANHPETQAQVRTTELLDKKNKLAWLKSTLATNISLSEKPGTKLRQARMKTVRNNIEQDIKTLTAEIKSAEKLIAKGALAPQPIAKRQPQKEKALPSAEPVKAPPSPVKPPTQTDDYSELARLEKMIAAMPESQKKKDAQAQVNVFRQQLDIAAAISAKRKTPSKEPVAPQAAEDTKVAEAKSLLKQLDESISDNRKALKVLPTNHPLRAKIEGQLATFEKNKRILEKTLGALAPQPKVEPPPIKTEAKETTKQVVPKKETKAKPVTPKEISKPAQKQREQKVKAEKAKRVSPTAEPTAEPTAAPNMTTGAVTKLSQPIKEQIIESRGITLIEDTETPSVPRSQFNENEIEQAARIMLKAVDESATGQQMAALPNAPVLVFSKMDGDRRMSRVISGFFQFYAAQRAFEIDPKKAEQLSSFWFKKENELTKAIEAGNLPQLETAPPLVAGTVASNLGRHPIGLIEVPANVPRNQFSDEDIIAAANFILKGGGTLRSPVVVDIGYKAGEPWYRVAEGVTEQESAFWIYAAKEAALRDAKFENLNIFVYPNNEKVKSLTTLGGQEAVQPGPKDKTKTEKTQPTKTEQKARKEKGKQEVVGITTITDNTGNKTIAITTFKEQQTDISNELSAIEKKIRNKVGIKNTSTREAEKTSTYLIPASPNNKNLVKEAYKKYLKPKGETPTTELGVSPLAEPAPKTFPAIEIVRATNKPKNQWGTPEFANEVLSKFGLNTLAMPSNAVYQDKKGIPFSIALDKDGILEIRYEKDTIKFTTNLSTDKKQRTHLSPRLVVIDGKPIKSGINKAATKLLNRWLGLDTVNDFTLLKKGETKFALQTTSPINPISVEAISKVTERIGTQWRGAPSQIEVVENFADLPKTVQNAASKQNIQPDQIRGVYHDGTQYIVRGNIGSAQEVEEVLFHEALHDALARKHESTKALSGALNTLFIRMRGQEGIDKFAQRHGVDLTQYKESTKGLPAQARRALLVEELLANIEGTRAYDTMPQKVKRAIREFWGTVRAWASEHGFDGIARLIGVNLDNLNDADIAYLLRNLRQGLQGTRFAELPTSTRFEQTQDMSEAIGARLSLKNTLTKTGAWKSYQAWKTFVPKKLSWWDKSLGTMYNIAEKHPAFKVVFDIGQDFLSDVSAIAVEAETKANNIFRQFGSWKQARTTGRGKKADVDAAGVAIYEGTLTDEKVYTQAELRSKFNLSDKQIGLYEQARDAADTSLDSLTKSAVFRLARTLKINQDAAVELAKGSISPVDYLAQLSKIHVMPLMQASTDPAERKSIKATLDMMGEFVAKAEGLKDKGYFPLMRFGQYTVDVINNKTGEREYFSMFESAAEADQMAKAFESPDVTVTTGIMSKQAWKLYPGLSPDVIESFARVTGLDQSDLFQDYLRLAVKNQSALKRLIERKKIPGFSTDLSRTLANFIVSNARLASTNYNLGKMRQGIEALTKGSEREKGQLADQAINLWDYLTHPTEEFAKFRGFLFFHFLGGSPAAAAVNLTQVPMVTSPYLHQFGGDTVKTILKWANPKRKPTAGSQHEADLIKAQERGIVAPQEIYQLMATAQGGHLGAGKLFGSKGMQTAMHLWGSMFSAAEQYNRRTTFNASYDIAEQKGNAWLQANGFKSAYDFAVKAVNETQFIYNRGNRPRWARGIGAPIFTFKQFSISYLEFLGRLPRKQRALAGALLILAAGAGGLPFKEDIEDIIDTIGQWMGYNANTRKGIEDTAHAVLGETFLGETLGGLATHGVTGLGIPLDIHSRLSMANLLPGTSMLKPSTRDKKREVLDVFGAGGGLLQSMLHGTESAFRGDMYTAGRSILPKAIRNLGEGMDMLSSGIYKDFKGRKITDVDTTDAFIKMVGFHPSKVADLQRNKRMLQTTINLHRIIETSIADKWARGIVQKDKAAIKEATDKLAKWNKNNPDMPIMIKRSQIVRRVRMLRLSARDRFLKATPKELRSLVAEY